MKLFFVTSIWDVKWVDISLTDEKKKKDNGKKWKYKELKASNKKETMYVKINIKCFKIPWKKRGECVRFWLKWPPTRFNYFSSEFPLTPLHFIYSDTDMKGWMSNSTMFYYPFYSISYHIFSLLTLCDWTCQKTFFIRDIIFPFIEEILRSASF